MAVPNWFLSSFRSVLSTQPNTPSRQSNWFVNNQRNTHVQDWLTTSLMEKFNWPIKSGTYRVLAVMTSKRALIFKILIICLTVIKDQESQIYLSTCLRISYVPSAMAFDVSIERISACAFVLRTSAAYSWLSSWGMSSVYCAVPHTWWSADCKMENTFASCSF